MEEGIKIQGEKKQYHWRNTVKVMALKYSPMTKLRFNQTIIELLSSSLLTTIPTRTQHDKGLYLQDMQDTDSFQGGVHREAEKEEITTEIIEEVEGSGYNKH